MTYTHNATDQLLVNTADISQRELSSSRMECIPNLIRHKWPSGNHDAVTESSKPALEHDHKINFPLRLTPSNWQRGPSTEHLGTANHGIYLGLEKIFVCFL